MKLLYIGNVLSQEIVDKYKLSIAGKKYELSLLDALNDLLESDLEIISMSRIIGAKIQYHDNLFPNKKYKVLHRSRVPIISDFFRSINFFCEITTWYISNLKLEKSVLLLNSPFGMTFILVLFRLFSGLKVYSLTIDTPFISENRFKGILGIYTKIKFKLGHKLLHFFTGIVVLNKNVVDVLNLKIPYLISKIGYDSKEIIHFSNYHKKLNKFIIVYAGTLMKFKGTDKLVTAVSEMNPEVFELIICGDGPFKDELEKYSRTFKSISYMGRLPFNNLKKIFNNADLLINITQAEKKEDFGFPSKLIDYILSGKPVLTNPFPAMPLEFYDFVHVIDSTDANGIRAAIDNVSKKSEEELQLKCKNGYKFIIENYSYTKITDELLAFINKDDN